MGTQKPKMALFVKRTFNEKMSATVDFISENWKPLLKYTTYLLLPLCLVQGMGLNKVMSGSLLSATNPAALGVNYLLNNLLYMLAAWIGTALLSSLVYTMVMTHQEREEGLKGVTLGMMKPLLLKNLGRVCRLLLFGFLLFLVLAVVFGGVAVLIIWPFSNLDPNPSAILAVVALFLLLLVALIFLVYIPLSLWIPVYLFEDIPLWASLKKAFRLGYATFGGVLAVLIVLGLVGGILQGITMAPWYIAFIVKVIFTTGEQSTGFVASAGYDFMLYVMGIVQSFGAYVAAIITLVGMAVQYGHAREKLESVSVDKDINNFEQL